MLREFTGGGIDDTAALMALVASAAPQDKIMLYGKCVTSRIFSPSCSWGGASPFESQLVALAGSGATSPGLASISDRSGISVTDIGLVGEGVYYPAAQPFGLAVGAPTMAATDQLVENVMFSKFNAGQWINGGVGAPCRGLRIRRSHFMSTATDYPGTGYGGTFIYLQSGASYFTDCEIDGCIMDGSGVAFGIELFGNHLGFVVTRNQISNVGANVAIGAEPMFGPGRYAITVYGVINPDGTTSYPINGVVSGNLIINSAEIGVYYADALQQTCVGNTFIGQSGSSHGDTLPHGMVVANGLNGGLIQGNDFAGDFDFGVNIAGGASGNPACTDLVVTGNRFKSSRDGSIAFNSKGAIFPAGSALTFAGNDLNMTGAGSVAFGGSLTGSGKLIVARNTGRAANIWGGVPYAGSGDSIILNPDLA